jgi:hypothetical protein
VNTDLLGEYRIQITEYVDNSKDERTDAELARDYFDGKQYTAEEIATLNARKQPIITDNKIKDKVEYLEGAERKTRTDPKAFPRTPQHDSDADVATDAIRYVFDRNRFSQIKSAVFQNILIEGMGGAEVVVDAKDPTKIHIRKVRWDRIYRDPHSMEPDFSDCMYRGVITWMDVSKAKGKWKGKDAILDSTMTQAKSSDGETQDDKPRWIDTKRKRVQVFEHYEHRDGKIFRSVFCWGGFLEEPAECPYVNDEGEHEDPIILVSAYVDREGRRYGAVKRYISLQDEVNKRRSKSLHLLNTAQIVTDKGAVEDINKARAEVHKSDGVIEKMPGAEFEVVRNLDLSAAHFQLLQQAEMALSVTGPNAALLGNSGPISGVAKARDQEGGSIQIGVLFDSIRDWQLRVARAVWNRIRQYWDREIWIRVTDDETGFKFVALNEQTTRGELLAAKLKGQPPEAIQQELERIAADPNSQLPATKNEVASLDVDIIIDEAPDMVTVQAEEFQKIAELASTGKVPIPPEMLIEASQLRAQTKKRIMDKLSGEGDPQAAQMAQMQSLMQQLAVALQQAEVRETNASADLKEAQAQKTQTETVKTGIEAATGLVNAGQNQEKPEAA